VNAREEDTGEIPNKSKIANIYSAIEKDRDSMFLKPSLTKRNAQRKERTQADSLKTSWKEAGLAVGAVEFEKDSDGQTA